MQGDSYTEQRQTSGAQEQKLNIPEQREIEQMEKDVQINNTVHRLERYHLRFRRMLGAAAIAASMSVASGYAEENQQPTTPETPATQTDTGGIEENPAEQRGQDIRAVEQYLADRGIHTRESDRRALELKRSSENLEHSPEQRHIIETLGEYFNNPEEIVRRCGGVIEVQVVPQNGINKIRMHLAQTHRGSRDVTQTREATSEDERHTFESIVSQHMLGECISAMDKNNKTGKPIPVGFEFLCDGNNSDPDKLLWRLVRNSLPRKGERLFPRISPLMKQAMNAFQYPPDKIKGLDAILHVAHNKDPEGVERVLDSLHEFYETDRYAHYARFKLARQNSGRNMLPAPSSAGEDANDWANRKYSEFTDDIMDIIKTIENVSFYVHDGSYPDRNLRNAKKYLDKMTNMGTWGLSRGERTKSRTIILTENILEKTVSNLQVVHDEIFNEREKAAFVKNIEQKIEDAETNTEEDAPFGVIVFGSGHDLANEAYNNGVQLFRAEMAPKSITNEKSSHQFVTHGYFEEGIYDIFNILWNSDEIKKWVKSMITMGDYKSILYNAHSLISNNYMTNEELYSLLNEAVDRGDFYWIYHHQGENEELLAQSLSPEHLDAFIARVNTINENHPDPAHQLHNLNPITTTDTADTDTDNDTSTNSNTGTNNKP